MSVSSFKKDRKKLLDLELLYRKGSSIVSDTVYDNLVDNFRVKYGDVEFERLLAEMRNYRECRNILDIKKFDDIEELKKILPASIFIVEPKIDGVFLSIRYKNYSLESILLKSDTLKVDVRAKLSFIVPNCIGGVIPDMELYAELFVNNLDYKPYSDKFLTARSFVVAFINRKDVADDFPLDILSLVIHGASKETFESSIAFLSNLNQFYGYLRELGFMTVPYIMYSGHETFFDTDCATDGIVFKLYEIADIITHYYASSNFYGYLYVYKFISELYSTVLDIEYSINKKSQLIPIAIIEDVCISGCRYNKINCFNARFLKINGINIGAVLALKYKVILNFAYTKLSKEAVLIKLCPYCNQQLEFRVPHLYCSNFACYAVMLSNIESTLKNLGSINIGYAKLKKLYDYGFIRGYADIFRVSKHTDKGKFSSVTKTIELLSDSRFLFTRFIDFLFFFNVDGFGIKNANIFSLMYQSYNDLYDDYRNDFKVLRTNRSIGAVLANTFIRCFNNEKNILLLEDICNTHSSLN